MFREPRACTCTSGHNCFLLVLTYSVGPPLGQRAEKPTPSWFAARPEGVRHPRPARGPFRPMSEPGKAQSSPAFDSRWDLSMIDGSSARLPNFK
jgi:hypothetical protein